MNNDQPFHLAALLWRNKTLIRIGINSACTSPKFKRVFSDKKSCFCAHAELDALQVARPGDVLEVIRWSKLGHMTMAKPCKYCMKRIQEVGLKRVTFTNWEGQFEILREI